LKKKNSPFFLKEEKQPFFFKRRKTAHRLTAKKVKTDP